MLKNTIDNALYIAYNKNEQKRMIVMKSSQKVLSAFRKERK